MATERDQALVDRRIKIAPNQKVVSGIVPGSVFRIPKFVFKPQAFIPDSSRLNERIFEEVVQLNSLADFEDNPKDPIIYAVAGNPDDGRAKLFAAHLVNIFLNKHPGSVVEWHSVNGSFSNPLARSDEAPGLIVLTNLSPAATQVKLDKVRDICEKHDRVPRILVIAGEDPISFMATRLYLPCHAMAYFSDSMVKAKTEVL